MAVIAARKLVLLFLLLAVARRTAGQGIIGRTFPCEDPAEDPNPNDNEDNLSCPFLTNDLVCYSRAEMCNGLPFCPGGSDEGLNLFALDCDSGPVGMFACSPGDVVSASALCDGARDCQNGDDETTTLCENKCLIPYYGGCNYTQNCTTSEFDVGCRVCLRGFVDNPLFGTGIPSERPCLLEIGLERTTYTGSETDGITEEICAVLLVDPADFVNGIIGVFEAIRVDFNLANSPVIVAQITSIVVSRPNAAQAIDFEVTTFPVTLSVDQTRDCIQFGVADDVVVDPGEVFDAILTTSSPYATTRVSREEGVVTIDDNDELVSAVFQPVSYNVDEDAGTAEVCVAIVARSPTVTMLTGTSTVTPQIIGGSATAGLDFISSFSPAVLVFTAGTPLTQSQFTSSTQCFTFPIIDDDLVEVVEDIQLGLINPTGLIDPVGLTSQATVFINIDERAEFQLDMSAYTIAENGGALNVFALIANGAVLGIDIEVTVSTASSNPLSAVAPADYTASSMVFTFNPVNSGPMLLSIPIVDDAVLELDETFRVVLSVNGPFTAVASAVNPFDSPVTILDNEPVRFNVVLQSNEVLESAGNAVLVITADNPIPGPSSLTLLVSTVSGTAAATMDFTPLSAVPVTFDVGTTGPITVPIPIINDNFVEDREMFDVTVISGDPRAMISGSPATVTIIDDDRIIYGFTMGSYSVTEGSGPMTVTLQLEPGSGIPLITFIALVSTTPGTATVPADFTGLNNFPVEFPALSNAGATQNFFVAITNDAIPELTESFTLSVGTNDPDAIVATEFASGFINDDDDPVVGLQQIVYNVDENMGSVEVCVQIFSPGSIPVPVNVNFDTQDGSAMAGMDYVAVMTTLSFPAGSATGTSRCVDITILNDNVLEMNGENFFADISSSNAVVSPGRGRATIIFPGDDDQIECNFDPNGPTVVEDPTMVEVCIVCNSNTLSLSSSITLQVTPSGGSATAGLDYSPTLTGSPLVFTAGNTRRCVSVPILEDPIVEATETIILVASPGAVLPPGVSIGTGTTTVTIIDDDALQIRIVPPTDVSEDGGPAVVCVEVINNGQLAPGITAVVNLATMDGTANAPADYTSVSMALTFNSGNTGGMLCISIPIEDDNICENSETILVDLTSTDPNAIRIPPLSTSVTITDNDVAQVALTNADPNDFSDGAYIVTECSDEGFYFDISIINSVSKGPGVACEISVQTEDGTALAGSDYVALDGTCILNSLNSDCEFHIEILDDFTAEMNEYYSIILTSSDPTRCNIANDNITIRIIDDEDCDDEDACEAFEMCEELRCPRNFTCTPVGPDIGDDPHFAVTLESGKTLCYTVQGEHGFAFNLISNQKVYMNAMFVPDRDREEVTWLGTMGIVVNNNGYKKSNMTKLRFEAIKNKIHVDDQMVLEARNIEKITIQNGKLTISEAPPVDGYKTPFVRIDLKDVELSFSVKFMTEHLDLYWHSTGQNIADSHGLIGQFFHHDVVLDVVRKILMIPGKEPVPIQRKPVWAFMEREAGDSSNYCWVAMNPGFQGEGLIDGTYFDYLVDDVLSTEFKFKKL